MLNKYYVSIECKTTNKITIYIINTMYNINELSEQLHNMYNDNYVIHIERYNYMHDVMLNDVMNICNMCVARNVKCYNL